MRLNKLLLPLTLLVVGLVYWGLFYFRGGPAIAHGDWVKEQVYLDTLRLAVEHFQMPWAWDKPFYHSANLFMANPEVVFTPNVLLLRWLTNGQFFYLHHCILFTLGFFFIDKIAQEARWRTSVYMFVFLLFNFNGYITSHISEGHFQWTGYYLIPAFLYFLYKSSCAEQHKPAEIFAGCILGALFANGSFHIAIWLSLFTTFLFVFERKTWVKLVVILTVGYGLGAFRVMPALAYFSTAPTAGMQSGYADVSLLLNAFTQLRAHGFGANTTQGWWEYSLYVGFTGFFLLVVGVARYLLIESKHNRLNYRWVFAAVLMFLLSLGNTWGILATFQLPFGSIERLSSRFIAIPFLLSVLVSGYAINNLLADVRRQQAEIFLYVLVMFVGIDLFYQLLNWSLIATELASGGPKDIPTMALADTAVAGYKLTVTLAWLLSAVAAATSYLYLRRTQPLHASKLR
jgi:hypothetical protein